MVTTVPRVQRCVAVSVVVVLVASVAFSAVAAADPRIFTTGASVQEDSVLVGQNTTVNVSIKNTGDSGGGYDLPVKANSLTGGSHQVGSQRVTVDADEEKTVQIPITVEKPGDFKLRVDDRSAGWLNVSHVRTTTVSERDDGRTVLLEVAAGSGEESMRARFPAANASAFAVQEVRMNGSGAAFNRSVATYAPASAAPFSVPDNDAASVIGAVEMDEVGGVETTSIRVSVPRTAISEAGLSAGGVDIYRVDNGSYEPLAAEQVSNSGDAVVYEGVTDNGSRYLVGSLQPSFAIENRTLRTSSVADGKQITVAADVVNAGQAGGEYTVEMRVDGTSVDERTVTLAGGGKAAVTLNYTVSDEGTYDVTLDNQTVGSVVLTGDGDAQVTSGDSDEATNPGDGIGDSVPSLPDRSDVGLFELAIGAAVVLLGGGLLLVVRR